jgi:hypothetical protein
MKNSRASKKDVSGMVELEEAPVPAQAIVRAVPARLPVCMAVARSGV